MRRARLNPNSEASDNDDFVLDKAQVTHWLVGRFEELGGAQTRGAASRLAKELDVKPYTITRALQYAQKGGSISVHQYRALHGRALTDLMGGEAEPEVGDQALIDETPPIPTVSGGQTLERLEESGHETTETQAQARSPRTAQPYAEVRDDITSSETQRAAYTPPEEPRPSVAGQRPSVVEPSDSGNKVWEWTAEALAIVDEYKMLDARVGHLSRDPLPDTVDPEMVADFERLVAINHTHRVILLFEYPSARFLVESRLGTLKRRLFFTKVRLFLTRAKEYIGTALEYLVSLSLIAGIVFSIFWLAAYLLTGPLSVVVEMSRWVDMWKPEIAAMLLAVTVGAGALMWVWPSGPKVWARMLRVFARAWGISMSIAWAVFMGGVMLAHSA